MSLFDEVTEGLRPDGAAVLDSAAGFLRRYVVFSSEAQLAAVALWVAHCHAIESADVTPYLAITSAAPRSGKSRLLEALELLVPRPWFTGRTTAAVLVRKIAAQHPTLLLDESDAAFGGDKDYAQALRQVLNLGHRRGGKASVCVGQSTAIQARDFEVFGPKAIAGIGVLPDTVADRSVPVRLVRRARGERVERFRLRDATATAAPIREALEQWASESVDVLRDARPEVPGALSDRAADGWEALLAIADAVGGDWPERARAAAVALHAQGDEDQSLSLGVLLLAHCRAVFDERQAEHVTTADLLAALVERDEGPWAEWWGRTLREGLRGPGARLVRLLSPFDNAIRPKKIRTPDGVFQGYQRSDFEDAWRRYLPQNPPAGRNNGTSQVGGTIRTEQPESVFRPETASEQACSVVPSLESEHAREAVSRLRRELDAEPISAEENARIQAAIEAQVTP